MKEKIEIETVRAPCERCSNKGWHWFFGEKEICSACNGCGYIESWKGVDFSRIFGECQSAPLEEVLAAIFKEDKAKAKSKYSVSKAKSRYSVCKATLSIIKKLKYSVGKMEVDSLEEAEKYIKIEEITDWACGQLILDRLPVRSVVKTLLGKYGIEPLSGD